MNAFVDFSFQRFLFLFVYKYLTILSFPEETWFWCQKHTCSDRTRCMEQISFTAGLTSVSKAAQGFSKQTHINVSQHRAECRNCVEPFFPFLSFKVRASYSMLKYILFRTFFCSLNFPISVHLNGYRGEFLTSHGVMLNCGDYEASSDRKDLRYFFISLCCLKNDYKKTLKFRIPQCKRMFSLYSQIFLTSYR